MKWSLIMILFSLLYLLMRLFNEQIHVSISIYSVQLFSEHSVLRNMYSVFAYFSIGLLVFPKLIYGSFFYYCDTNSLFWELQVSFSNLASSFYHIYQRSEILKNT